jgi:hypothetical protein
MECQIEKNEHFRHLLLYEFNRGSKAGEAARNICAVYGEDSVAESTAQNGLRASSKAILTRVTLHARGGIWWDMEGIVHYELLERNLTVTAERYCQQLRRLEEVIQHKRPGRRHGVILQHDNARPLTANMTKAAVQELDWEILPHPPYSPDLTPSNYHLFRSLQQFAGSFLQQRRRAPKLARRLLHGQTGGFFMPERWQTVVNNGG